jgi:hypothetical protein
MDADPHGTKKSRKPLALLMSHGTVVSNAVLGLKILPFLGEFSSDQVGPVDSVLLFKQALVSGRIGCRVKRFISKVAEKSFMKDV